MEKFCNCKTIGGVARDMNSTCMQCGGVDAYKKSKLRISDCGCRFENDHSNSVLLCEECSKLPCHTNDLRIVERAKAVTKELRALPNFL